MQGSVGFLHVQRRRLRVRVQAVDGLLESAAEAGLGGRVSTETREALKHEVDEADKDTEDQKRKNHSAHVELKAHAKYVLGALLADVFVLVT